MKLNLDNYFKKIRSDFPILNKKVNGKKLVYFDSGATSQKPKIVINSLEDFYLNYNSNVHRGIHTLSEKSTNRFEEVRDKVANLINVKREEVIFTSGSTHSINQIAFGLEDEIKKGDEIVLTQMEHHANIVPWVEIAKKKGALIRVIPIKDNFELDYNMAKEIIGKKTKLVSFCHVSNVLGTINDVKKLVELASKFGAYSIVDGAQGIVHEKIDIRKLNCDFYVFSAHKFYAPTGVGVLCGKSESLKKLKPLIYGGSQIKSVDFEKGIFYQDLPYKLESGTPNIGDVIAFGKAIDYIEEIGFDKIKLWERELGEYFLERVKEFGDEINIYGSFDINKRVGVFSFSYLNIHPSDLSTFLDQFGVAIRSGFHCTEPLHKKLNLINGTSRVSFAIYNSKEEIDYFFDSLKEIKKLF